MTLFLAAASLAWSWPTSQTTKSKALQARASLPSTFSWSSTDALVGPKDDSRGLSAIKDPSIVYYNNAYHVFASTVSESAGYNLVYFTFSNFSEANDAEFHYLDETAIGTGYRAAPQVFYMESQSLWYLVFQNGNAAYSTNSDITNPDGWSAVKTFYSSVPTTVTENLGSGSWLVSGPSKYTILQQHANLYTGLLDNLRLFQLLPILI